jgi:hypothetical protein
MKHTIVIREKSSLGELAIISDSLMVPRGSGCWSLRVPVICKCAEQEQELDPVVLSGSNGLVKLLGWRFELGIRWGGMRGDCAVANRGCKG